MITVLVPRVADTADSRLQRLSASGVLPPFSPLVIDFLDALSKAVLLDPSMRRFPEMAAVAHWMRKAHVLELKADFERMRADRLWAARGVALHFAPANVDSIFVYSWFLSMLMGNANIVRLSERRGEQVSLLLGVLNRLLDDGRFAAIADRSLVISYAHDDAVTRQLSSACQLRIVWGGDESVRRLRAVPLNPLASEIVFPNRFSLAAVNATQVAGADAAAVTALASRFVNDSYWFDQMACSSPRLVVWVGPDADRVEARARFWPQVAQEVARRKIEYPDVIGLNKLVSAYVAAATGVSDAVGREITGAVSTVHLAPGADGSFRQIECGGGLFFETEAGELDDVAPLLTERDQTLAYFGFTREQLTHLAHHLPTRAVDRIVPIGTALNFSTVWDGCDLLQSFGREIELV